MNSAPLPFVFQAEDQNDFIPGGGAVIDTVTITVGELEFFAGGGFVCAFDGTTKPGSSPQPPLPHLVSGLYGEQPAGADGAQPSDELAFQFCLDGQATISSTGDVLTVTSSWLTGSPLTLVFSRTTTPGPLL